MRSKAYIDIAGRRVNEHRRKSSETDYLTEIRRIEDDRRAEAG